MTIDEAIEILSESANMGSTTFNQKFKEAEKLGIEALKACKERSARFPNLPHLRLPGETEK